MTLFNDKQKVFSKADFPNNVRLLSTPRFITGGAGKACSGYDNFNLATHVGDDINAVERNRGLLIERYQLPSKPKYLEQIHSNICLDASSAQCAGDAQVTTELNKVCLVMTADCLPIFASNTQGTQVGVAHAGWKGVVNGVIESFVSQFDSTDLIIHFGPAISQQNFEVGQDVFDQFIAKDKFLQQAFTPFKDRYKLDIYLAARIILNNLGVKDISGGDVCTFSQQDKYFSYRRDGIQSGRMAHLIWIE